MQDDRELSVIVKPHNITWDDISQVLRHAHQKNIEEGIYMHNPFLPPDEIKEKIDKMGGVMFVALLKGRLVGTGAVAIREIKWWCAKGQIGYICFGSVLPEFAGKGVYKALVQARENYILSKGVDKVYFDTHENNKKIIDMSKKRGFSLVDYAIRSDHNSVLMIKWLNERPYSNLHCSLCFIRNKYLYKTISWINRCILGRQ